MCVVRVRSERAASQRIDVAAALHLGEVHVCPALGDMANERLVRDHVLTGPHRRNDVPVLEAGVAVCPDDDNRLPRFQRRAGAYNVFDERASPRAVENFRQAGFQPRAGH